MISVREEVLVPLKHRGIRIDKYFVDHQCSELEKNKKGSSTFLQNFNKFHIYPEYNMRGVSKRCYTSSPNIQGIDKKYRPMILPYDNNQYLFAIDFKQIEFALYVDLIKNKTLISMLNKGFDFHKSVAEKTGIPRDIAKRCVYGYMYGAGNKKINETLGLNNSKTDHVIETIKSMTVKDYHPFIFGKNPVNKSTKITTYLGREVPIPQKLWTSLNTYLQSSVVDLTFLALNNLYYQRKLSNKIVLFLHDSFLFSLEDLHEETLIKHELDKICKLPSGLILKYSILKGERGIGYDQNRMEQVHQ